MQVLTRKSMHVMQVVAICKELAHSPIIEVMNMMAERTAPTVSRARAFVR